MGGKRRLSVQGSILLLLFALPTAAAAVEWGGYSRTTLRGAWADAPSGQDDRGAYFSEYLSAEVSGLPADTSLYVSGAYQWDLGQEDAESTFYTPVSRFSDGRHLFVYDAALSARPAPWAELTAGRFDWKSAEDVHIDGAAVSLAAPALPFVAGATVRGFGGRVVRFYDDLEESTVYGVGVDLRLPWDVLATVDYLSYFQDLTRATLRKSFGNAVASKASAEWVNSDLREALASATLWLDQTGTEVTGTFYKKVGNEDYDDFRYDYTDDADPGRYQLERLGIERLAPFNQYHVGVHQAFGPHATASIGYTKRDLIDEENHESASNTSFDVIQAGLSLAEPGFAGLFVSGQVSWWKEERLDGHEAGSRSYSLSAEQRLPADVTASVSYYWKEDDLNNEFESAVARSLRVGLVYRPDPVWDLAVDYTHETDDLLEELYGVDAVQTVESRLTVRF